MIHRIAETTLTQLAQQFKALAIVGPRQSGKTTLARHVFSGKSYTNLENPDIRRFATEDPRGFLAQFPDGAVIDEVQRVPELFSYLQQILDESRLSGQFILTGSNNFLLQEKIAQSLAGRIAYLYLLPFATGELPQHHTENLQELMFRGLYPPLYDQPVETGQWHNNYIRTYIERDVRQIKNINDLVAFEHFLRLCAGRVGQLLNKNNLALETGVDNKTVDAWLSVLESSFILFRLHPHHKNFNKRVVKMPKLYFYDSGLVCALLSIHDGAQLIYHPLAGSIFENFVTAEMIKSRYNQSLPNNLYFWRDSRGHEIDIIIENANSLFPVEIKAGKTITPEFFRNLIYWEQLTGHPGGAVVYAGEIRQKRSNEIEIIPWKQLSKINQ
ncbi:MAG: ATP-binding protein [Bacteroidales bacterium]|nr:ATP-binding protein [Bacteroidales bacterium]